MTPENYSFAVSNEGEVWDEENRQGLDADRPPKEARCFSRGLWEEYSLAQKLPPVQWLLYRRWAEVDALCHPCMQVWATINDGVPHVWLSIEFIVDNEEDTRRVQHFAQQVGGIFWTLFEDPYDDGLSVQYEVDIDVLELPTCQVQELMNKVKALLRGFEDILNVPM
jgi:hypothetical protein